MKFFVTVLILSWVLGLVGCNEKIDFSTQVKPILNKRCISCHGGVKRNGNFSVLFRQDALDTTESGKPAIIPGDADHSEMIRRLTLTDPEERMPYKEEPLPQEEIEILKQWINEGAEWGDHWAYVPPKPVEVPGSENVLGQSSSPAEEWAKNDIDRFVLEKLKEQKLEPSPEADSTTLVRRVYMDLIGLPPTPDQALKFLKDETPEAYEKMVDELLASPHFGEKWAAWWLDLARYSDTKGYERDAGRTIWRYRDWVIKAFNDDVPFDRFTIEQLAGDLLPSPTDDQFIATGFHRNTMNNDEGGTEDEEFRVAALIDRVSTTWEVWQSTTMACVQCHTHPYDPFVHDEYYKAMAFFNNTRDEDTEGEHPNLRFYKPADQENLEKIRTWAVKQRGEEKAADLTLFLKTLEPKHHPHDFDQFVNGELIDTKWLGIRPKGSARLKQITLDGKEWLIINYGGAANGGTMEVRIDKLDGEVIGRVNLKKWKEWKTIIIPLKATTGKHDLYFRFDNPNLKPDWPVCAIEWFAFRDDFSEGAGQKGEAMTKIFLQLLNAEVEKTPVMVESNAEQHRDTYVFERGNWLVKGKPVTPEVPRSLNAFPGNMPHNRLGFAKWLMQKDNPLTARSIVNRLWEQLFGYGIVETLEDFGTQGAPPSHPKLLDWMALRMMNDHQWSMKKMIKEIVMSATYRQESKTTKERYAKDPSNQWLSRGPRIRLTSEQVRDQALAIGGLLSPKMYGPSVMPYQPEGIWSSVWNEEYWKKSAGEDQFRRSIYTYLKRTSPYPSMMMFDGSSREVCVSRRIRTNTPLQALVTLNDSSFVAASRSFAHRMMKEGDTAPEQIRAGYKIMVVHDIPQNKLAVLNRLYTEALEHYTKNEEAKAKLTADTGAAPEVAALTIVANAMLNLDEVITKE